MPNYAVDFKLEKEGQREVAYSFRFGHCDDFPTAMMWVKKVLWPDERTYEPDKNHLWTVVANDHNLSLLCSAFANFRSMYDLAKNQLSLPGMQGKQRTPNNTFG